MVHTCQKRIGVKGIVELRLSNNMVSPAVCGLLRHIIIVPTGLLEEMDRSKLAMVLMHELSHIKHASICGSICFRQFSRYSIFIIRLCGQRTHIFAGSEQAVDEMVLTRLNCAAASLQQHSRRHCGEGIFAARGSDSATVSIVAVQEQIERKD